MIDEWRNKVICTDALKGLKQLPDNSRDLVVTDPPYGYSFMGKDWDRAVPSVDVWRECLRVLKCGAFCFVMSSPRQDVLSQMLIRLESAGFVTGFTSIYWAYASGFPKAGNIGKMVDKRLGAEREVIGKNPNHRPISGVNYAGIYQGGNTGNPLLTKSATPQAKVLDGSYAGFQPKPAVEVIIVAMKPCSEKTFVDQALKSGKGVTWLDDCRVPYESEDDIERARVGHIGTTKYKMYMEGQGRDTTKENPTQNPTQQKQVINSQGRFPANLLVSDDVLNDGKISVTRPRKQYGTRNKAFLPEKGWNQNCMMDMPSFINDSGSFSRYFDLDAWAVGKGVRDVFPFLIVPKASKGEKNAGLEDFKEKVIGHNRFDKCENCDGYILQNPERPSACKCEKPVRKNNSMIGNYHPTVKPIKLMAYLVTLGSRKNDLVLDLFIGSGTTAIACKQLGRDYLGFEISEEYCEIARKRLEYWNLSQTRREAIDRNVEVKEKVGKMKGQEKLL